MIACLSKTKPIIPVFVEWKFSLCLLAELLNQSYLELKRQRGSCRFADRKCNPDSLFDKTGLFWLLNKKLHPCDFRANEPCAPTSISLFPWRLS